MPFNTGPSANFRVPITNLGGTNRQGSQTQTQNGPGGMPPNGPSPFDSGVGNMVRGPSSMARIHPQFGTGMQPPQAMQHTMQGPSMGMGGGNSMMGGMGMGGVSPMGMGHPLMNPQQMGGLWNSYMQQNNAPQPGMPPTPGMPQRQMFY